MGQWGLSLPLCVQVGKWLCLRSKNGLLLPSRLSPFAGRTRWLITTGRSSWCLLQSAVCREAERSTPVAVLRRWPCINRPTQLCRPIMSVCPVNTVGLHTQSPDSLFACSVAKPDPKSSLNGDPFTNWNTLIATDVYHSPADWLPFRRLHSHRLCLLSHCSDLTL